MQVTRTLGHAQLTETRIIMIAWDIMIAWCLVDIMIAWAIITSVPWLAAAFAQVETLCVV